jgi:hypothetical protein
VSARSSRRTPPESPVRACAPVGTVGVVGCHITDRSMREHAPRSGAASQGNTWGQVLGTGFGLRKVPPGDSRTSSKRATKPQRSRENKAGSAIIRPAAEPFSLHGKEGVDGSSPSEGSAKAPQIAPFSVGDLCRSSSMRWVWSLYGAFSGHGPIRRKWTHSAEGLV